MALAVYNGDLIAGGDFTSAGGASAAHIARWNGSSWQAVGSGIGGSVFALGIYDGEVIARFKGGDLVAKFAADSAKLTPDDFRLRADSPGYRAGDDGKDLGADVDLVGPGAAYERWKMTPAYQQWLVETGQIKK